MELNIVQLQFVAKEKLLTSKIALKAISYTDAEKQGFRHYENNTKGEASTPHVVKITKEKVDAIVDLYNRNEEDAEFLAVYKCKAKITYKEDEFKPVTRIALVRAIDIDVALAHTQSYLVEEYNCQSVEIIEIKETDYSVKSPIFSINIITDEEE